jgi:membrane protein implicated in regulation of membrane protease activity
MVLFLLLLIAAIVLGILGVALKGTFYLFIIGVIVLIVAFVYFGTRLGRGRRRPSR